MSEPVLIAMVSVAAAFVAGLPATIAAIASLRQGQRNAVDAGELKKDVAVIHTLANSTNSNLTSALAVATEKIAGLEKAISQIAERDKVDLARQAMPLQHREVVREVVDANGDSTKPKQRPPAELVDEQGDRIEKTGDDTNKEIKEVKGTVNKVETRLGDRVEEVKQKLEEKRDKDG